MMAAHLGFHLRVLGFDTRDVFLETVDFLTVLVLDAEVFRLELGLANRRLDLVDFLDARDQLVKLSLEILHLRVDFFGDLILLGLLEQEVLDFTVAHLDLLDKLVSLLLDALDVLEHLPDILLLLLEVLNDLVDALQVLVPVNVLWHLLPLVIEERQHFFLVGEILERLLNAFLRVLDLIHLVLVFDLHVAQVLLLLRNLSADGLLQLVPLLFHFVELLLELANFHLEHAQVLVLQLAQLADDFVLLLDRLLLGAQTFLHFFLLFFNLSLLLDVVLIVLLHLVHLALAVSKLLDELLDDFFFFGLQLVEVQVRVVRRLRLGWRSRGTGALGHLGLRGARSCRTSRI